MKAVLLTKADGRFALVDPIDVDWVTSQTWPYHRLCAGRRGGTLHRAIATRAGYDLTGTLVSHRNGWRLDCRRENLWIAPWTQIARCGHRPNIHKFHSLDRRQAGLPTRWRAQFAQTPLGEWDTEAEAIEAYEDEAARRGILTDRARAALLQPVIEHLDELVAAGVLIKRDGGLIEDRYRLK